MIAVRSSATLPVVFHAVRRDSHLLADGGLSDNTPVAEARRAELQGLWDKELQTGEGWGRIADAQEVVRDLVGLAEILPESQRPKLVKLVWARLNADVDQTVGELRKAAERARQNRERQHDGQ